MKLKLIQPARKPEEKIKSMGLSLGAIQRLLGIKGDIPLTPEDMAKNLTMTFFPVSKCSKTVECFANRLKNTLNEMGIKILPYREALILVEGKEKIKKGIIIIALGESKEGNLPIDNTISFTESPIVTIIDTPSELTERTPYEEHMEIGLNLFTWHMSNIVICVMDDKWIIYSFNGYSPFYKINDDFNSRVLNNLIPKIVARVNPPQINEFKITKIGYNFMDNPEIKTYTEDLVESGPLLARTGLFAQMRKLEQFKYRNDFYKWVASLHLDERKGMSYGFVARQLPLKFKKLVPYKNIKNELDFGGKDFLVKENKIYILIKFRKEEFVLEVPPVWVLMSRSGSEKTKLNPHKDILKIGLVNGEMIMEIPPSVDIEEDYKPSFDTRVILSHCLANAIYGNLLKEIKKDSLFSEMIEKGGLALAHWHPGILPGTTPQGWYVYGEKNPPVLCSSAQSAIYAFQGKESAIKQSILSNQEFLGDIQVEPQHGINVSWGTLNGLANYLLSNLSISKK